MIGYAALLLLLLISWVFRLSLLSYVIYSVAAVWFVSRFFTKQWADNASAVRTLTPREAEQGQQASVLIEIRNAGNWPILWMLAEDYLSRASQRGSPAYLRVIGPRLLLAMIAGGGSRKFEYRLECNRRGYHQIGPLLFETGDLFGLHRRHRVLIDPDFLLVLPKIIPMEGYDIASRRPVGEIRMTYRLFEDPTRISGIRDYRAGDALSRIHWRASARTGTLQCKTYEPSSVSGATILLDFHVDSYPSQHEPYRSELAITAVASIANALAMTRVQIGLVSNGRDAADRIRFEGWSYSLGSRGEARRSSDTEMPAEERLRPVSVETKKGEEQFERIHRLTARLELNRGLTLPELLAESQGRLPRNATVIAVVPNAEPATLAALGELHRQGYAVSVILNIFDTAEFAAAAGALAALGVEARHLRDEDSIREICRRTALR